MDYRTATERTVLDATGVTDLRALANGAQPAAGGAIGRNQAGYLSVKFQERAIYPVLLGVMEHDAWRLGVGLEALEYGFDFQETDGSFPIAAEGFADHDVADAAAMFLAQVGRALLFAGADPWASPQPSTSGLRTNAQTAAVWLNGRTGLQLTDNAGFVNRIVFGACGLVLPGLASGNYALQSDGWRFVTAAVAAQRADGVLPEAGGYDSSYQAVSLLHLIVLLLYLPANRRATVWPVIQRGMAWFRSRILPSGEVSTEGNSRVYPGGETFLGAEKGVNYADAVQALTYYGAVANDPTATADAVRVRAYYT